MEVQIRLAKKGDLQDYTKFLQTTYQKTYPNEKIGLTKDCFSKKVFSSIRIKNYLLSNLKVNNKQKAWLAFVDQKLIGSISIIEQKNDYELRGFYVAPEYQNHGIGKNLWQLVLEFVKNKDITCDIYLHNTKTVELYKKWGFIVDAKRGEFDAHWPEWPEGIKAKAIYMRYKKNKTTL